ncbi:MAG: hypothetical protein KAI70_07945, partial [Candidatus Omnitrophica bacterium]|nr:hypothetical protein [Candidatus Omnitrophota bacterium]
KVRATEIESKTDIKLLPADDIFKSFSEGFKEYVKRNDSGKIEFKSGYKIENELLQVMQWCYAFFGQECKKT